MRERLAVLMQALSESVDGVLITSQVGRRYFTGLDSSAGILVVSRRKATLFIDFRYIEAARSVADGYEVSLQEKLGEQLSMWCASQNVKSLGVENEYITVSELLRFRKLLPQIRILSDGRVQEIISRQRRVKSEAEIAIMRRAQRITDCVFEKLLPMIRPGVTEREVAVHLATLLRQCGAQQESFETIAVAGPNTSMPHGHPTDRAVVEGDLFTLDFGVVLDGYCSDMTRTMAVGRVSDEQRKVYETVLCAQEAAFAAIRPGAVCKAVDAAARSLIARAGYDGCFGHGLGHSLGLEIHESPAFNTVDETVLCPGMVLSVEPGIYLEGRFGVRIEDVVVVTVDGFCNLTGSPKQLLVL